MLEILRDTILDFDNTLRDIIYKFNYSQSMIDIADEYQQIQNDRDVIENIEVVKDDIQENIIDYEQELDYAKEILLTTLAKFIENCAKKQQHENEAILTDILDRIDNISIDNLVMPEINTDILKL